MIGVRRFFRKSADQTVSASTALVDCTGLAAPVAANEKIHFRFFVPFTVGATGGFKFQLTTPAGVTNFLAAFQAVDGVTAAPGSEFAAVQAASAAFANAWAVAGTHFLIVEGEIVNGATAGSIQLQFACNSAANGITVVQGASVDVINY